MKKIYTEEERRENYRKFMAQFHNNPANLADRRATSKSCSRCGGEGWIKGYEHRDGGRCYNCNGSGKVI